MLKTVTAVGLIGLAGALAGCVEDIDPNSEQVNAEVARQINSDQSNAAQLLKRLQEQDPTISDVHFKGEPANRVIVIARKQADGSIVTTEMPYNAVVPQEIKENQSSTGSMLTGAALGMMAGMMLSNMNRPSAPWSSPAPQSSYEKERERNRSSYVGSAANTYRSSYVSSLRSGSGSGGSKAAPNTIGKSSGGSFASTGGRSAGGSSGSGG